MDKYLLSIIIPIYNLEKYINKCLESIISQIEQSVEIILIDDGSTDSSKNICEAYGDKYNYIKYFYQQNSGVSVARNSGLEKAQGKYILFIDGDDWIVDGTINSIITKLKQSEKIDILAGDFVKENIKQNPRKVIEIINTEYPNNLVKLFENNVFNPSLCCNVFKKELFIQNNIYLDKDVKYTEDMDCTLQLFLKANKIDLLEKPFYIYRKNQSSATHSYSLKRVEDTMNFVTKWKEKIKEIPSEELKKHLFNFIQYQYSIVVGMFFLLKRNDRKKIYFKVKENKDLLKGGLGKKGKIVTTAYNLLGFNLVGKLMGIWIKNKEKIGM